MIFGSALRSRSSFATGILSWSMAQLNGDSPSSFNTLTSAPLARHILKTE